MSGKRPFIRGHECAYCRKMQCPQGIKVCSGCKVMGYCSKECQKADWKYHKTICTKTMTGETASSRPPAIKLVEKMMTDDDLMCHIDGILIKALDLEHHPENAEKYAVALSCHVESTDTKLAASRLVYYMNGQEPPPLPDKIPKLFQISKHALLSGDSIPRCRETARPVARAWPSEAWREGVPDPCDEMIDQVASWMVPKDHGEGFTDEPMSTERLIKLFDIRVFTEPDMKKKLTIMASTR